MIADKGLESRPTKAMQPATWCRPVTLRAFQAVRGLLVLGHCVLLGIVLCGCRSAPEASASLQAQAMSFSPPPGKAGIYVGRQSWWGTAIDCKCFILHGPPRDTYTSDDVASAGKVGLPAGYYGYVTVDPGIYTLKWNPEAAGPLKRYRSEVSFETYTGATGGRTLPLTVESGKNYFFKTNALGGASVDRALESLSSEEGPGSMSGLKASGLVSNPRSADEVAIMAARFEKAWAQLRKGMTLQEVNDLLGTHNSAMMRTAATTNETLFSFDGLLISFSDGKLSTWGLKQ